MAKRTCSEFSETDEDEMIKIADELERQCDEKKRKKKLNSFATSAEKVLISNRRWCDMCLRILRSLRARRAKNNLTEKTFYVDRKEALS